MCFFSVRRTLVVLLWAAIAGCWTCGGLQGQTSGDGTGQRPAFSPGSSSSQSQNPSPSPEPPSDGQGQVRSQNPSSSPDDNQSHSQSLQVPAQSEVRSEMFHLKPGTGFEVTGNSDDRSILGGSVCVQLR